MPTAGQDGCWFLAKQTRKYHQGCLLYIHVNNIKDTRKIPPPSSCSYPPHTRLSQAHTGQGWACAWGCGQGPRQVHLQHEGMGWQKGRCGEFLEYFGKRLLVSSKTHCSFCVYSATEGILRYLRVFTPSQPWQAKGITWVVDCSAVKKSMSSTEKTGLYFALATLCAQRPQADSHCQCWGHSNASFQLSQDRRRDRQESGIPGTLYERLKYRLDLQG